MDSAHIDRVLDEEYEKALSHASSHHHASRPDAANQKRGDAREPRRRRSLSPDLTDVERDKRTVFVRQLAQKITSPILQEFFEKAGPVRHVKMVTDRVTKKPKGLAYVEFRSESSVAIAVSLTGQKILGVPIVVEITETEKNRIAEEAAEASKHAKAAPDLARYDRVCITSLHPSIDERALKKLFESVGMIEGISIGKTEEGRPTGIAIIRFKHSSDARLAVERMNGISVAGQPISTSILKESFDEQGTLKSVSDEKIRQLSENVFRKVRDEAGPESFSQCLCLQNMYDVQAEVGPNWQAELLEDVTQECGRFGKVVHANLVGNREGEIYLKFDLVKAAEDAFANLNGRWFAERKINAKRVPLDQYNSKFLL